MLSHQRGIEASMRCAFASRQARRRASVASSPAIRTRSAPSSPIRDASDGKVDISDLQDMPMFAVLRDRRGTHRHRLGRHTSPRRRIPLTFPK